MKGQNASKITLLSISIFFLQISPNSKRAPDKSRT